VNHSLIVLLNSGCVVQDHNFCFEFTYTELFKRLTWVNLCTTLLHLIGLSHVNSKQSHSLLEGVACELKGLILYDTLNQ